MSDDIAIKVENLTKIYKLYDSPQDRLKESLHPLRKKYHKDFYALNDVSFEVKKGETVGIIGRNGSGKSTLLKLITGVLTPSSGSVTVNGRVSALLELGAGFNPQLTGLENVYFNGTIMGYTHEQMDARLDDILAFADIGDFIHQPVKTYSSGMFIRLAFAVAVNVDPDILIIDEAMAVGDARFSKKCYDRFNDFRTAGKTILLVSHSTEAIKTFANQSLFLNDGHLEYLGEPKEAVDRYLRMMFPIQYKVDFPRDSVQTVSTDGGLSSEEGQSEDVYCLKVQGFNEAQRQDSVAWFKWVKIYGLEPPNIFHGAEVLRVVLRLYWLSGKAQEMMLYGDYVNNIIIGLRFQNKKGINIFATNTFYRGLNIDALASDSCELAVDFTMPRLCRDDYFLSVDAVLGTQEHHIGLITNENLIHFECSPLRNFFHFIDVEHEMTITNEAVETEITSARSLIDGF